MSAKLKRMVLGFVVGAWLIGDSALIAGEEKIQIARDGKALTTIILPEKPTKTEIFSGKELQKYLKKITGADLEVVSEKEASSGIYVGRTSLGAKTIKTHRLHEKDIDSFLMEAKGNDLVLVGNCDRSTLYAVYTFLEKLGCLWLAPGIDEIPKKSILDVSDFSQIEEPAFKYRSIHFAIVPCRNEWESICLDWAVKQKINFEDRNRTFSFETPPDYVQERGGFRGIIDVHQARKLLTKELYKKHPEWFALVDGKRVWRRHSQPCTTNPEYIDFVAEHIKKFFAARPEIEIFPLTQSDGTAFCQCPKCTALDIGEEWLHGKPVITERWLTFVNQVAEKVAKEYPDKKIYTLAYHQTMPPPDPKRIKPAKNVVMGVVHSRPKYVCFLHEHTNRNCPNNVKFLNALKEWCSITKGGVLVYDYYGHSSFIQLPYIAYKKAFADLKNLKKMGVIGFESQIHTKILGTYLVDIYALCRAMWNPEQDPEIVMDRFFNAMYKESAEHVKKFCDFLEEKREACSEHSTDGILPYLTRSVIEEAEVYINQAMRAAKSDEIRLRVQVLQDNFLVGKYYRLGFDAFSQYEKTGKVTFLKDAINHFKEIMSLSEEAHKDKFRKNYGILWASFLFAKDTRYPKAYLSKWEGTLKNHSLIIPYKEGIKTGVYVGGIGADKIVSALSKVMGLNPFLLPRLDKNTISSCHVIIKANTGNMVDSFNGHAEDIRKWVENGGKVMLLHDAVGYRKHKVIFPDIGRGSGNPKLKEVKIVKSHPVTKGLKVGESFFHSYYDHIAIAPGKSGEIIIKDKKNNAVVVAGKAGKGKVVLNGMISGYGVGKVGVKEEETEPKGGELKVLINAVKWLGSK